MKQLWLTFVLLFCSSYLFSQIDLGLPAATGKGGVANGILYDWECIGINPSNLGWEQNHSFSLTAGIFGISAQSAALNFKQLKAAILSPGDTFSLADKKQFASLFTNKDGINLQSNLTWLAFSFSIPKLGGFAVNLRERTFAHVRLNENAADMLFLGKEAPIFKTPLSYTKNISSIIDGSIASYMHYRELNVAYGTKLLGLGGKGDSSIVSVYGGIGLKYLWGLGNFEVSMDNGAFIGHSSLSSKYGVNYGNVKNFNPESTAGVFPSVGNGTAIDLGIGIKIKKMKITVSAIDLGHITWSKNVLEARDTLLPDTSKFKFGGINSWDMVSHANQLFTDNGLIKFKPGSSYSTPLPSRIRMGIGYQFTKRFLAGADVVLPINNNNANLNNPYVAVGTQTTLASNFIFSIGLAGNSTYGLSIPCGVTLGHFFKILEVSVATNDILTYIAPGNNPNISLAVGVIRINF